MVRMNRVENTRDKILEISYEILGEQGLENLHARVIAAQLQVNHATVHYYFKTRADLLVGVAEHALAKLKRDQAKFVDGSKPGESLASTLALYEAYCQPQSRFFKVWASLFVAGQASEEVRAVLDQFTEHWFSSLEASIKRTREAGVKVRKGALRQAEILASTLLGMGLISHMRGAPFAIGSKFDVMSEQLFGE